MSTLRSQAGVRLLTAVFILTGLLPLLPVPVAADENLTKILFVGDSITAGICDGTRYTFRDPLLTDLEDEGYLVDAIGHLDGDDYPGTCFSHPDSEHSSVPGRTADGLLADMRTHLSGLDAPDVAMLLAGVNDLNHGDSAATIVAELQGIVDEVQAKNPAVHIFMGTVMNNTGWGPGVTALNTAITNQFGGLANITLVDLNAVFVLGVHDSDGLHPNQLGAQLLADEIRSAMVASDLLAGGPPPAPPGGEIVPTARYRDAPNLNSLIHADDYSNQLDAPILRLYQAYFNRLPDLIGSIYWLDIRRAGYGQLQIAGFMAGSQEFANNYAGTSDEEYLRRVYQNVLGRNYDQAGFNYWLDAVRGTNEFGGNPLRKDLSRAEVVFYFTGGEEFIRNYPYTNDG